MRSPERCRPLCFLPAALLWLTAGAAAPQSQAPSAPLEEIVRRFAEKEVEYATAHALYRYRLRVKIQELGEDDRVVGEFEQVAEVGFDASGRRRARVLENPRTDLLYLDVRRIELTDLEFIPLFILAPEEIPRYQITYLSRERLDEVDTYLFRLDPREVPHGLERFFEGVVWVDTNKLDIVRALGRSRSTRPRRGALKGYFERVEIFREPVDDYLFTTYVGADDVIRVRQGQPVRARLIVRFTNYERVREPVPARAK